MPLEWDRDGEEIWSCIRTANFIDDDYFEARRKALAGLGYDSQDIDAALACEKRGLAAMKVLTNVYLDEYFGLVLPEEAKRQAQPYLDEYNTSMKIMADIRPSAPQP